ncbi:extensin family protein [Ameyamaea chiangmaiensis NBRC 103196]|nr:extensin family protein [Ameyamaea chiangmaiensis]MBS4074719.1 extensin family protein [Ameyamaea chiangmaiensis]GBQ62484.1 extensin family protein [Ameyamaea chiangmaiensis NBRC 103196]
MRAGGRVALALWLGVSGLGIAGLGVFHRRWLPAPYDPLQPLDVRAAWTPVSPLKLGLLGLSDPFCNAALATVPWPVEAHARSGTATCPLRDVYTVDGGDIRLAPGGFLASCSLAVRWALFETQVATPIARDMFGSRLIAIRHVGSFACRDIRDRPGAQSSHATANAIDVAGFTLADGREIPVSAWHGGGPDSVYLHRARDGACRVFGVVLSPAYNALHAGHLHLQATGGGLCR